MEKQEKYDQLYMDLAERISLMSYAVRSKVGVVIVKNDNIISFGWNGMPSRMNNCCEKVVRHDELTATDILETNPEVLHAESNALMKLVKNGNENASGATLYITLSPCFECAKLILQSGIKSVVYKEQYRNTEAIDFLRQFIQVEQLELKYHR